MITFTIGLFAILYISTPILSDIKTDDGLGCYIRAKSVYYQIYPILQVFIFGVLSPCLMIVLGILAICNTKRVHLHPVHISHHRRTERQLGLMLFIQVSTYIILNLPICTVYIMLSFIPLTFLTSEFIFIITIFRFFHQFSYTTPFLLYIISGHNFRKELLTFINRILTHLRM